jgi:hypothetical protein
MRGHIIEQSKETPVLGEYEVVVLGAAWSVALSNSTSDRRAKGGATARNAELRPREHLTERIRH